MNTYTKVQAIDQKIAALKKRKSQIARQHLQAQARLIQRCGLQDLEPATFAGALLEIKQQASQKQEVWRCAGETFLGTKRSTKSQKSASQGSEN